MSNSTGLSPETINTVLEAVYISSYLNICFMVAEIAVLAYGPQGSYRQTLDTLAHILAGPISFLGFLNGGFVGSLFFFLSLWHFLCDSGQARPSLIRECPTSWAEFWVWFESCWLLLHHIYIGAFKLLSTDLAGQLEGVNTSRGPVRFLIRTWVGGATMSHLSFGMTALHLKGATFFRALSVFMRMGAAIAIVIVHSDQTALRMAYTWDLVWMGVILSLTVRKALCGDSARGHGHGAAQDTENPITKSPAAAASSAAGKEKDMGEESAETMGDDGGGLRGRLVKRVRKHRRESEQHQQQQMVQLR
jgi:hypothetical protein